MSPRAFNRKGAIGIAGAFALCGLIAYWNWGPTNITWLQQPRGFHDSSASWLFADEWTSENGYAPVASITYIGYGPDAWRWEVELEDGEDLVFHWRGDDLLCSVFLNKPFEPVFDDQSSDCEGLRAPEGESPQQTLPIVDIYER